MDHILCHICNMWVPDAFAEEHNCSVQHRTYIKIINTILGRAMRAISDTPTNIPKDNEDTNADVYFCPSCVMAVDFKDKIKHNMSLAHRNSVNFDRVLQHFLAWFSNDIYRESELNHNEPEFTNTEVLNVLLNDELNYYADFNSPDKLKDISSEHNLVITVDNEVIKNNHMKCFNTPDGEGMKVPSNDTFDRIMTQASLGILKKSNNLQTSAAVFDNTNINILISEGSSLKITENNFHGFKIFNETHFLCLLCTKMIRYNMKKDHISSKKHLKKLSVPFKDSHCIREIDDDLSLCMICNKYIKCRATHINYEEHVQLLKAALITNAATENVLNDVKEIKIRNLSTHTVLDINQKLNEINGFTKYKALDSEVSDVRTYKSVNINGFKANNNMDYNCHYTNDRQMIPDNKSQSCATKSATVNNKNGVFLMSTNTASEGNTYNTESELKLADKNNGYCEICKVEVTNVCMDLHLITKIHQVNEKVNNLNVHYLLEPINDYEFKCKICQCIVINTSSQIDGHLKGNRHIKKYNNLLIHNNVTDFKNGRFFCNICDVEFLKMKEITHVNKTVHTERLKRNLRDIKKKHNTKTLSLYFCDVCNVKLANVESSILQHNQGVNHLKNIEKLYEIKLNGIQSKSSTLSIEDASFKIHLKRPQSISYCQSTEDTSYKIHLKPQSELHSKTNVQSTKNSLRVPGNTIESKTNITEDKLFKINIESQNTLSSESTKNNTAIKTHLKDTQNENENILSEKTAIAINPKSSQTNIVCQSIDTNSKSIDETGDTSFKIRLKPQTKSNNETTEDTLFEKHLKPPTKTSTELIEDSTFKTILKKLQNEAESQSKEDIVFKIHHHMIIDGKKLYCIVCNIRLDLSEENMNAHIKGIHHNKNYNRTIFNNFIDILDQKLYCELCGVNINVEGDLMHCNDKEHLNNLNSLGKLNLGKKYTGTTYNSMEINAAMVLYSLANSNRVEYVISGQLFPNSAHKFKSENPLHADPDFCSKYVNFYGPFSQYSFSTKKPQSILHYPFSQNADIGLSHISNIYDAASQIVPISQYGPLKSHMLFLLRLHIFTIKGCPLFNRPLCLLCCGKGVCYMCKRF